MKTRIDDDLFVIDPVNLRPIRLLGYNIHAGERGFSKEEIVVSGKMLNQAGTMSSQAPLAECCEICGAAYDSYVFIHHLDDERETFTVPMYLCKECIDDTIRVSNEHGGGYEWLSAMLQGSIV